MMSTTSGLGRLFLPANSSKATQSQKPTSPIRPLELFTKSFAGVTSPPDIRMPCGENSLNTCDLPVPFGPSSMKL